MITLSRNAEYATKKTFVFTVITDNRYKPILFESNHCRGSPPKNVFI